MTDLNAFKFTFTFIETVDGEVLGNTVEEAKENIVKSFGNMPGFQLLSVSENEEEPTLFQTKETLN